MSVDGSTDIAYGGTDFDLIKNGVSSNTVSDIVDVSTVATPSSVTDFVYEFDIILEHLTTETNNKVLYRRGIQWNFPSDDDNTACIEIEAVPANVAYLDASNKSCSTGFNDVLGFENENLLDDEDESCDQKGSSFQFNFGALEAGSSKTFKMYYVTAPDEDIAAIALGAVEAEMYVLYKPTCSGGLTFMNPFTEVSGDGLIFS